MDFELTYADIPSHDGYRAGTDGSIWTCWIERHHYKGEWRRLKTRLDKKGYERVSFGPRGTRQNRLVHQLVLLAFRGPCPAGMECLHGNDVRHDNRLCNLRYGTHLENVRQAVANGNRHGIHSRQKLTTADVLGIKWRLLHGERQGAIAFQFGVSRQLVQLIRHGHTNNDVTWLLDYAMDAEALYKPRGEPQGSAPCPSESGSSEAPGTTASKTST